MQFEDENGKTWNCRVDWSAMRRSAAAGVDLSTIEELLGDFYRGSHKLIDALWAVLAPQAEGMTFDQFAGLMQGDVMERARDSLVEGLIDFFPQSRRKLTLAANADVAQQFANLQNQFEKSSTASQEKSD